MTSASGQPGGWSKDHPASSRMLPASRRRLVTRWTAIIAALAISLGMALGANRPALAAATSSPGTGSASLSVAAGTSQLWEGLFEPSGPSYWCSVGDYSRSVIPTNIPNQLSITSVCQLNTNLSMYLWAGHTDNGYGSTDTTCTDVQGPANDADIDPSGVALECSNGSSSDSQPYITATDSNGNQLGYVNWDLWARLYGTSGTIQGSGITYSVSSSSLTITTSCCSASNSLTLDPVPTFTATTSWVEIAEAVIPANYDGNGQPQEDCLYVDNQSSCEFNFGGVGLASFNYGPSYNNGDSPLAYWGWGLWPDQTVLDSPPSWSEFGSLGCPGVAASQCSGVETGSGLAVPADCNDTGTMAGSGTGAGSCVWASMAAYWYAMITAISNASGSGAYTGSGPAGTACAGGVIMPLSGACKPGLGTIPTADCSAYSTSVTDFGADVQWLWCSLTNGFITVVNWVLIAIDAIIDMIYPNVATDETSFTTFGTTLATHVPFSYIAGVFSALGGFFQPTSSSPSTTISLPSTWGGWSFTIDLEALTAPIAQYRDVLGAFVVFFGSLAIFAEIRRLAGLAGVGAEGGNAGDEGGGSDDSGDGEMGWGGWPL